MSPAECCVEAAPHLSFADWVIADRLPGQASDVVAAEGSDLCKIDPQLATPPDVA